LKYCVLSLAISKTKVELIFDLLYCSTFVAFKDFFKQERILSTNYFPHHSKEKDTNYHNYESLVRGYSVILFPQKYIL